MISTSSRFNHRTVQKPVFTVSHSRQEEICKEVFEYIVRKKIQKLKGAVLQFNKLIRKILK